MALKEEPRVEPAKVVFPGLLSQILSEAHLSLRVATDNEHVKFWKKVDVIQWGYSSKF